MSATSMISRTMSRIDVFSYPASRCRMKYAFSEIRLASTTRKIPSGSTRPLTSRRFAIENGWPPIRLVVASIRTNETFFGPALSMAARSRSRSMFPLNGQELSVFSASGPYSSSTLPPAMSKCALVVVKW